MHASLILQALLILKKVIVIKNEYAFDLHLSRSGAIQRENFKKSTKETDGNSNIQGLNPSVFHQDSPNGSAVKYDDVHNPESMKSVATHQINSKRNKTVKNNDVC